MAGIKNTYKYVFFLSIPILCNTILNNSDVLNKSRIPLRKCCPIKSILKMINGGRECQRSYKKWPNITVYNTNSSDKEQKTLQTHFNIQGNGLDEMNVTEVFTYYYFKVMDDGTLRTEVTDKLITNSCFDYEINENEELVPICLYTPLGEIIPNYLRVLKNVAMFISCFFLLLVIAIYLILDKKRNLNGLMTITWVFCVLNCLLDLAIIRSIDFTLSTCKVIVAYLFFFTLSSFSWMTVISFDIWLMSRNHHQVIARRHDSKIYMFMKYAAIAFAVPCLMALIQYSIQNTSKTTEPVKQRLKEVLCPFDDRERNIYLYVPMICLIFCSTVFYALTEYNLRKHFHETKVLYDCCTNRTVNKQKNHLWLFIKLSAVVELSWVLEVISAQYPDWPFMVWYIPDLINCLKGVWIFVIFISKGQTCKLLKQKLRKKSVKKEVRIVFSLEKDKELSTSLTLQNITTDESG